MGEDTPELRAKFRASIPLGRLSTPLDIANAALWLASDEAEFITGVSSPMNCASMPVSPATGHRQFTRMFFGASSTAIDFVAVIAQPFEALYQVRPGRGRKPAVEAVVMIEPPPCFSMIGTTASAAK